MLSRLGASPLFLFLKMPPFRVIVVFLLYDSHLTILCSCRFILSFAKTNKKTKLLTLFMFRGGKMNTF